MNKKERVMLLIGIGILVFVVIMIMTGCSADSAGFQDGDWTTEVIPLLDGRTVTCVLFDGYDGDTISCDWAGASDELEYVVIPQ